MLKQQLPPIIDRESVSLLKEILLSTSPEEYSRWVNASMSAIGAVMPEYLKKKYPPDELLAIGFLMGHLHARKRKAKSHVAVH